jgi:hypothetical protein
MSRYTKTTKEGKTLIYGWDHALGYFYEIWNPEKRGFPEKDRCSIFGMPKYEMVDVMSANEVNSSHIQKLALDLPF